MFNQDLPTRKGTEVYPQQTQQPLVVNIRVVEKDPRSGQIGDVTVSKERMDELLDQHLEWMRPWVANQRMQAAAGVTQYHSRSVVEGNAAISYTYNLGLESVNIAFFPDTKETEEKQTTDEDQLCLLVFYKGSSVAAVPMEALGKKVAVAYKAKLKNTSWPNKMLCTCQVKFDKYPWVVSPIGFNGSKIDYAEKYCAYKILDNSVATRVRGTTKVDWAPVFNGSAQTIRCGKDVFSFDAHAEENKVTRSDPDKALDLSPHVIWSDLTAHQGRTINTYHIMDISKYPINIGFVTGNDGVIGSTADCVTEEDKTKVNEFDASKQIHNYAIGYYHDEDFVIKCESSITFDANLTVITNGEFDKLTVSPHNVTMSVAESSATLTIGSYELTTGSGSGSLSYTYRLFSFPYALSEDKSFYLYTTDFGGTWHIHTPYKEFSDVWYTVDTETTSQEGWVFSGSSEDAARAYLSAMDMDMDELYWRVINLGDINGSTSAAGWLAWAFSVAGWAAANAVGDPAAAEWFGQITFDMERAAVAAAFGAISATKSTETVKAYTPVWVDEDEKKSRFSGWLQLSNGTHMIQGFAIGDTSVKSTYKQYAYLDGKDSDFLGSLATELGCDQQDINTMVMDVPLSFIKQLS